MVLVFSSTHAAMAAEDALREAGIPLQIIPLPNWVSADCGLAVRLDKEHVRQAEEEIIGRGIRLRGVYEEPP
ncbi:MAG: DUF3343 domain-containing protein [Chloroflexota bacterium]